MGRPPGKLKVDMDDPFVAELIRSIGQRSVLVAAEEWRVPYYVLRDTIKRRTRIPRNPKHTAAIAAGMGISVERFLALAYAGSSPQEEGTRPHGEAAGRGKLTAHTS